MNIYLAGGMHSDWRERFAKAVEDCLEGDGHYDGFTSRLKGFYFLDPCAHKLSAESEYTAWDLLAVRKADVLVAYMEPSNPSGYGMMLEMGYAHALGKTVVFVSDREDSRGRYFGIAREAADVVVYSLNEAARFVSRLPWVD